MGAWGLGLFQCDHDYNLLNVFYQQLKLEKLEIADGKKAIKRDAGPAVSRQNDHRRARENDTGGAKMKNFPEPEAMLPNTINYSVYKPLCSNPDRVRDHLDNSGWMLDRMEKMRQGILVMELEQDRDCKTCYGPSYQLCLLGACAMTLGARIPKRHRKVMREVYRDVGFMRDAVTQLGIALDQDEGYVNGVPWDFGSLGFEDYAAAGGAPEADLLFPGTGMLNVRAPDHKDEEGHPAPWNTLQKSAVELLHKRWDEMTAEQREITLNNLEMTQEEAGKKMIVNPLIGDFLKMAVDHDMDKTTVANHNTTKVQQFFGDDVCGGCGAKQRNDGSALIQCGKCKKRLYCGRSCQKKDWEKHKKICRKTKKGVAGPSHAKSAQTHTSGQPTSSDEEPFEQYAAYCIRRTSEQSTEK